jgi:broad specificity phosphatase PhoE
MQEEKKDNLCTLYLVRHGETEWNKTGITQGQSNSSLTETGIQQAKSIADKFKNIHFDAIFSSDLTRTQKTAEIIKLDREIIIQTSKLLRERSYGRFEGKHASEFRNTLKDKLVKRESLSDEESWSFELDADVETDEAIVTRFITQLREISVAYLNKTVLVVSHGGPIRMLLAKAGYAKKKDLPGDSLKNGGYVKILSDGVDFFIKEVQGIKKKEGGVI